MLRQNPHLLLMGALDFSASDLATNSRGALSSDQHQSIQQSRFRQIAVLVIAMIFIWISGIGLGIEWIAMAFVSAMLISLILSIFYRTQDDLKAPVQTITGRVSSHFFIWGCRVHVNNETFAASRSVGEAFVSGRIYRLYYTRASRILLSAELVA